MANPADVARLILGHCESLLLSPDLPIAWPDVAFTPPADGKYLRVDFLPNRPAWEGINAGRLDQGLLQITIIWPRHTGIITSREIAAVIMEHFRKGSKLTGLGVVVRFNREPWAAAPILEDSRTLTPITIPWVAS